MSSGIGTPLPRYLARHHLPRLEGNACRTPLCIAAPPLGLKCKCSYVLWPNQRLGSFAMLKCTAGAAAPHISLKLYYIYLFNLLDYFIFLCAVHFSTTEDPYPQINEVEF